MKDKITQIFKKFAIYIIILVVLVFSTLTYFIYNPPAFIISEIRKQAEVQILKATDLYASIDRISTLRLGLFHQTAVAEGITILKNNNLRAPIFIKSEKLEIGFNVISFLIWGAEKSTLALNIIKPVVNLNRNKKGEFDIDSPLFQPHEAKEEKPAEIPRIIFKLEDGLVQYSDQTFINKLKVNARIPLIQAELQNSQYVKYVAKLIEDKDLIDLKGTFNTRTGQGSVDSKINIKDFTRWANVFYDTTKGDFVLNKGSVDLKLKGKWENFAFYALEFNTDIDAKDIIGKFPLYSHQVNIKELNANITQNKLNISNLKLYSNGTFFNGKTESVYNGKDTYIKAHLTSEHFNLGDVLSSLDKKIIDNNIRELHLSGLAKADITLDGFYPQINKKLNFIQYPEAFQLRDLKGSINIQNGTFLNSNVSNLSSKIHMNEHDLVLTDFKGKAYDGTVTANLIIKDLFKGKIGEANIKTAHYLGNIKAEGINADTIINDFNIPVPNEYRPYARVDGNVKMTGFLTTPEIKGKIHSPLVTFNPKYSKIYPIENFYSDVDYSKDFIRVKSNLNSINFGNTFIDFAMKDLDFINVKAHAKGLKANATEAFVPNMTLKGGIINGDINTTFSLKEYQRYKKPSTERLTHIIKVKGDLDLSGVNVTYQLPSMLIKSMNTTGELRVHMDNGEIKSQAALISNDYGSVHGNFSLRDLNLFKGKFKINNIPVKTLETYIPSLRVKNGSADITTDITTSLESLTKRDSLTEIVKNTKTNSYIKFTNTSLKYGQKAKIISSTNSTGNIYLSSGNGNLSSNISMMSDEFGNLKGNFRINNLDILNGTLSADNFKITELAPFIPNLKIKSGIGDITANINTHIGIFDRNFSAEKLLNSSSIKGLIKLSEANLNYNGGLKEPIALTHTNGTISMNNNNGNLTSVISLASEEFGDSNLSFNLKKLNSLNIKADIEKVSANKIARFIPGLSAANGTVSLSANLNTYLGAFKNYSGSENLMSKIYTRGYISFDNNDLIYQLTNTKKVLSTNTAGKVYFSLKNGTLSSEISVASNELGNTNAVISINNLDTTFAKIDIDNIPVQTLELFVPKLSVKSGTGDITAIVNTSLKGFKGKITLDKLTYLLDTNSSIYFKNTAMTFSGGKSSSIDINNGVADIDLNINDGIVKSKFFFSTNEFGTASGYLDVDKDRNVNGKLTNRNINMINISSFIPNVDIAKGNGVLDIVAFGNIREFAHNPGALAVNGYFDIDNLNAKYSSTGKIYPLDINSYHNNFTYTKGYLETDMKLISKNMGNLNANFNLNPEGDLKGKIYSTDVMLANLNPVINEKNFNFLEGTGDLNINLDGNIYNIIEDPLNFKASGLIDFNKVKSTYIQKIKENEAENLQKEDISVAVEDTKPSSELSINPLEKAKIYNQNLDALKADFKWQYGLLDIYSVSLKNGKSEFSGKGNLNLEKLLNEPASNFGNITLNSDSFEFSDFPVAELAGLKDGDIKKLQLTADLSANYKNITMALNTEIKNLQFVNQESIDTVIARINFKDNQLSVQKMSMAKGDSYFDSKGEINLSNENDPNFNILLNSRKFPIQSIFSLIPNPVLKRIESGSKKYQPPIKDTGRIMYTLPAMEEKANESDKIDLNKLTSYWEKWSLEPNKEENENESYIMPHFWEAISGDISIAAEIKGTAKNPKADFNMLVGNAAAYNRKFSEIYIDASYDNGNLDLPKAHLIETEGGHIKISGNMNKNGNINFEGDGKIDLEWIRPFIKSKAIEISGITELTIDVKGTTNNPDVTVSFDSNSGVFNEMYFDNLSVIGSYKNNIINLAEARLRSGSREAKGSGIIPLDPNMGSMNLSLSLTGESLGLVNLFTHQIEWLKGDGDAFLNLQGSFSDPLLNGRLNISNAQIYVESLNENLDKVNLDVNLSNHFVKINKAEALLNDSLVNMIGQVDLIGFYPSFLKLKLFADDLHWKQDNMSIGGKVSITVNNTISEPLIGGKVQINSGEMRFGMGTTGNKEGTTGKSKKKSNAAAATKFNKLAIDVPKNSEFWVRSPFFDLKPSGGIVLQKGSIYTPLICGSMQIDKGNLYLINNEFKIKKATALFDEKLCPQPKGEKIEQASSILNNESPMKNDFGNVDNDVFPINPKLNVTAETKLLNPRTRQNVEVEAIIEGTLEDIPNNSMHLTWKQSGGLTESEIWQQVIGLNAAQDILSDTSSTGMNIAKIATPYFNRALFNPLTSPVADFLGLEEFNVGLASDTVSNPGVSISASKTIIGGLSIGYEGILRTTNIAQYNFFTRYQISNNLSVRGTIDERSAVSLQGEIGATF